MPYGPMKERNSLTSSVKWILSWSGRNDPDGLHTYPTKVFELERETWRGTPHKTYKLRTQTKILIYETKKNIELKA